MGVTLSTIPQNIPTASPYSSQAGSLYYPMGSQNGMILSGTYNNLWNSGAGLALASTNDFSIAVQQCSAVCDSDAQCLSFNVLTVEESDFNNGIPTYECRFSNKVYDASDYTLDNGLPSYVWSISTDNPACDATGNPAHNPQAWVSAGMDKWLQAIAAKNNLIGATQNFASSLMNSLGWTYYTCDSEPETCSTNQNTAASSCANWVNIQIANYQSYLQAMADVVEEIEQRFATVGADIFSNLWWTGSYTVPTTNAFNPTQFCLDLAGVVATFAPIPGLSIFTNIFLQLVPIPTVSDSNNPPAVNIPSSQKFWTAIMTSYDQQFFNLSSTIHTVSKTSMQTSALLADVTQKGDWFIPNPSLPDWTDVWRQMAPYFTAKLAMQAVAAQQVFFVSLPVDFSITTRYGTKSSGYAGGSACTQQIADQFGGYFNIFEPYVAGTAFCQTGSNNVIMPLVGFTPNPVPYTNYGNVVSQLNSINTQYGASSSLDNNGILSSSLGCTQAQPKPNSAMTLYYSPALLSAGFTQSSSPTESCVWSVPVFDWNDWYPLFTSTFQKLPQEVGGSTGLDMRGLMHNYVSFLAYQLGFQTSVNIYYDEYANNGYDSNNPWTGPKAITMVNQTDSAVISTSNAWGV